MSTAMKADLIAAALVYLDTAPAENDRAYRQTLAEYGWKWLAELRHELQVEDALDAFDALVNAKTLENRKTH